MNHQESPLKVLHISSGDLVGSRFNGYDWIEPFKNYGIDSKMKVCWNHHSDSKFVTLIDEDKLGRKNRPISRFEYKLRQQEGKEDASYSWAKSLLDSAEYTEADLIHLQIIHDGTLDFETMRRIFKEKPTVWTWHDPWPLTGHCIYPMSCREFANICTKCPDLERPFEIGFDFSLYNRRQKEKLISENYTLHVASKWFQNFILANTDSNIPDINYLPFGINSNLFKSHDSLRAKARKQFGIPLNAHVIGARAMSESQKNFDLIQRALTKLDRNYEVWFLTLQEKNLLLAQNSNQRIIDLGWTNSTNDLKNFYSALDIFLMPSLHETFGLMALEAALASCPVIGIRDTAVDEIVDLSNRGLSIEGNGSLQMAQLIEKILDNKELYREEAHKFSSFCAIKYDLDPFLKDLSKIYRRTFEDFHAKS